MNNVNTIGSFDFDEILQALPLIGDVTSWHLALIYTDFKVSSTYDLYHGEYQVTEDALLAHKKLPQELSHLQLNLRYRTGQQVFPVLSRMKVFYILHTYAQSPSIGQCPHMQEDEVTGKALFWFSNEVIGRLPNSVTHAPFSPTKVMDIDGWPQVDGQLSFFAYLRGRVLFGRNSKGILFRKGTTVSTLPLWADMDTVPSGQVLGIKDTMSSEVLFTFKEYE